MTRISNNHEAVWALALLVFIGVAATTVRMAAAQSSTDPICGPNPTIVQVNDSVTRQLTPVILAGIAKEGATIDEPTAITGASVAPEGGGLASASTRNSFTLAASASAEGKEFTVTVSYAVQPWKYQKVGHRFEWVRNGNIQARNCRTTALVPLRPLGKLILVVDESEHVKLAGVAEATAVAPSQPLYVDVSLAEPRSPAITGKKVGEQPLTFTYKIGAHVGLKAPLEVEVVAASATHSVTVMVGQTIDIAPGAVNLPGSINPAFTKLVSVGDPTIASVKKREKNFEVTGHKIGTTKAVAIMEATGADKKQRKIHVTIEIKVIERAQPNQPGQPKPQQHRPDIPTYDPRFYEYRDGKLVPRSDAPRRDQREQRPTRVNQHVLGASSAGARTAVTR